jgi:hypothetical protein
MMQNRRSKDRKEGGRKERRREEGKRLEVPLTPQTWLTNIVI